ncbi:MAG: ribonuclease III [Phycisphaerae bacterium]
MEDLTAFQEAIGYRFKDVKLLDMALTHTSNVSDRAMSNERLEFFGDAVLDLVICELLYQTYSDYDEGQLTQIKGLVVSRKICALVCEPLHVHEYVRVGRGTQRAGSLRGSIAAGVLEALIAAIYLDGGYEAAKEFIIPRFMPYISDAADSQHHGNYKSFLQQYIQKDTGEAPHYEIVDEQGPEHNKCFEAEVLMGKRSLGVGWGMNKKDAEQQAAYAALLNLKLIDHEVETAAQSTFKKSHPPVAMPEPEKKPAGKSRKKTRSTVKKNTSQAKPQLVAERKPAARDEKPAVKDVAPKTATKKNSTKKTAAKKKVAKTATAKAEVGNEPKAKKTVTKTAKKTTVKAVKKASPKKTSAKKTVKKKTAPKKTGGEEK